MIFNCWPHWQWDVVGFGGFLKACLAVLNGQIRPRLIGQISPRLIGFAEDPVHTLNSVNIDDSLLAAALDLIGLDELRFFASMSRPFSEGWPGTTSSPFQPP
jgi:hypothetical protein